MYDLRHIWCVITFVGCHDMQKGLNEKILQPKKSTLKVFKEQVPFADHVHVHVHVRTCRPITRGGSKCSIEPPFEMCILHVAITTVFTTLQMGIVTKFTASDNP